MEYRKLGSSGMMVSALSFGTATFYPVGSTERFGRVDEAQARRMVDLCLDAGITLFDTADSYGEGHAEALLGAALEGRRDKVLISTKAGLKSGPGPNDMGLSRHHLKQAIDRSLRQLRTDYIDIFQLHIFDDNTMLEESLATLQEYVAAGKIRYLGVSNFAAWQLMKSLAIAEKNRYARMVVHQVYYSLVGRDYELELMPLAKDQGIGAAVWSPLGWGRLTGKFRRGSELPGTSRLHKTWTRSPPTSDDVLFRVIDVLEAIAAETGKSVPQVALNWLLQRPTVSTIILGARNESQLLENLRAIGWTLTQEQVKRLDEASFVYPLYPLWHQLDFISDRSRMAGEPPASNPTQPVARSPVGVAANAGQP